MVTAVMSHHAGDARSFARELQGQEMEIEVWPGYAVGDVKTEVVIVMRDQHGTFLDADTVVLTFGSIDLDPQTQLTDHDISAGAQLCAVLR